MTARWWMMVGLLLPAVALAVGCKLTRAGYESAAYTVVSKSGAFEIRDYPPLALVSTPMQGGKPEEDGSFMRLFRYISGANEAEEKIAMTTPVFMGMEGTNRQMSFVVPKKQAATGAPKAKAEDVRLENREGGRYAVHRFSGGRSMERAQAAREKLAKWLVAEKLEPQGEPILASYDPPFTPPFLRRNEVMVRVGGGKSADATDVRR